MDLAFLRRWWPPVAVAALLAFAALTAAHSSPRLDRVEPPVDIVPTLPRFDRPVAEQAAASPASEPSAGPAGGDAGLPDWAGTAALGLLVALVAGIVVLVVWTVVRDRLGRVTGSSTPTGAPRQRAADEVVAALDAGLDDLSDADRDPRRAVIACWVRLEQAAAAAGTPRRPGDTPTDLVSRLLREQRVSADVLAGFAEVYREARYATHTVDDRMRAGARSALHRLRADLTAGAAS